MATDSLGGGKPRDYCTQRRLNAIYDARDDVPAVEKNAAELHIRQGESREIVALAVRKAVLHYVMELEPLLREYDEGDEYWDDEDLGTIRFPEADAEIHVVGLQEYVDLPDTVSASYLTQQDDVFHGPRTAQAVDRKPVPKRISMAAYRKCNQFMQDARIGLERGEQDETADPF